MPNNITHAVALFCDNFDGEKDIYQILVTIKNGQVFREDNGEPLLKYRGDEILKLWVLSDDNELRKDVKANDWRSIDDKPNTNCDVLLKDDSGEIIYGYYNKCSESFFHEKDFFVPEFWQPLQPPKE